MSQIILFVLFLKGSSWARWQFVSHAHALVFFPSLLNLTKYTWISTHTSANDSYEESLRLVAHAYKHHCDLIYYHQVSRCAALRTSQFYIVRVWQNSKVHILLLYTYRLNTSTLPDRSPFTLIPHRSAMSHTFIPIVYYKGICDGWRNVHLYRPCPLTEIREVLLGGVNVSVRNMHS